jgi:nitrate/nitrite-specific signal transduction histidine kinase
LQELVRTYGPGFHASIDVAPEITQGHIDIPSNTLLACYRIVEQAILNSVIHGQASEVTISVTPRAGEKLELVIADNGTGKSVETGAPGFGSAVIDSWCRVLNGSWSLQYPENGGAQLTAVLSLESDTELVLLEEGMSLQ